MEKQYRLPAFLVSGKFLINEDWGVEQLARVISDFDAVNGGGVSLSDLGYDDMKEKSGTVSYYYPNGRLIAEAKPGQASPGVPGSIAHVTLSGVMRMEDGLCSYGIGTLTQTLAALDTDPTVKGIVLEVNSGGGEVTAGQALYSAIADLSKPLVVAARFMASAALLGTLPAKRIIGIGRTSSQGSIGTVFSINKQFAKYYAEIVDEIYATTSPDKNQEWREYLKGNKKVYEAVADEYDEVFMDMVSQHRPLNPDTAKKTLRGGMFLAQEALDRGLIDEVGTMKTAYDFFNTKSDNKIMNFQAAYRSVITWMNNFFGLTMADNDADAVAEQLAKLPATLEAARKEATAEVSGKLDALQSQFDDLNAKISGLQDRANEAEKLDARLQTVEGELETVKGDNEKLKATNKDLEAELVELKGKEEPPKTEKSPIKGVEKFMDALGTLEVEGDSKY